MQFFFAILLTFGLPGSALAAEWPLTLKAGVQTYQQTPVTVELADAPAFQSIRLRIQPSGEVIPCQWERIGPGLSLTWMVEYLAAGESQAYRIEFRDEADSTPARVQLTEADGRVEVEVEGQPFTTYHFGETLARPFFHPLRAASGVVVTRGYPMEERPGETRDHVHHRACWFAWGDVNGVDFWTEGAPCGRMVHRGFDRLVSGPVYGRLTARNDWLAPDGKRLLEETRDVTFYGLPEARLVDFVFSLRATDGAVRLGDTKEGLFAIRVATPMDVQGQSGRIENSRGDVAEGNPSDAPTWGKRAEWCDYAGTVDGERVGLAIFDHPDNPRHPTFWMVRTYGLFAANPFGERAFTGQGDGSDVIPAGETLTLKYRLYLHPGNAAEGGVASQYASYVREPEVEVRP